jgi:hypothetical protein
MQRPLSNTKADAPILNRQGVLPPSMDYWCSKLRENSSLAQALLMPINLSSPTTRRQRSSVRPWFGVRFPETRYDSSAYCPTSPKFPNSRFGIRSVSVTLPHPASKIRYLSSAYSPGSALSELLIIGRSKAWAAPLSPSGPTILLFFIDFL